MVDEKPDIRKNGHHLHAAHDKGRPNRAFRAQFGETVNAIDQKIIGKNIDDIGGNHNHHAGARIANTLKEKTRRHMHRSQRQAQSGNDGNMPALFSQYRILAGQEQPKLTEIAKQEPNQTDGKAPG